MQSRMLLKVQVRVQVRVRVGVAMWLLYDGGEGGRASKLVRFSFGMKVAPFFFCSTFSVASRELHLAFSWFGSGLGLERDIQHR